jgi:membrane protease YdiL (CAAX protease family)
MSRSVEQLESATNGDASSQSTSSSRDAGMAREDGLLSFAESRALAACEIASVVASVVVAAWGVLALAGLGKFWIAAPIALALALMIYSHRVRGERLRDLGWRFDNFGRALTLLAPLMLAGALVLALCCWLRFGGRFRFGGGRAGWALVGFPVWGLLWGLVQQYALQGFINRRAQIIFGAGWRSILLVATLFALLHLPNPWLVAATFLGGLIWAYSYQRAPNLFALAISHAAMTWALVSTIPMDALEGLRVGFKYFG